MRQRLLRAARRGFLLVMLLGTVLITAASLVYFDSDTLAPFVIEKLPVRLEALWMMALKVHVASALIAFPFCLLLTTRFLAKRKSAHRFIGRATGILILFALVPSGILLSFEAKGGSLVTLGFLLSGSIVAGAVVAGVLAARAGNLAVHARFMRHVVGQLSVAVTSRAMLIALDLLGLAPDTAYLLALWVPVLASAYLAERLSHRVVFSQVFKTQSLSRSLS